MSNGSNTSLKRDVDAAFGAESVRKPKKARRHRTNPSRQQERPIPEANTTPSENKKTDLPNEPLKTLEHSKPGETSLQAGAAAKATNDRDPGGVEGRQHSKKGARRQQRSLGRNLSLSSAEGGRFGDHDPILVQEDRLALHLLHHDTDLILPK